MKLTKPDNGPNILQFLKNPFHNSTRLEFTLAVISGILIVIGWILNYTGQDSLSVVFFIASFLIGGFFKAREGVTETIKNKTLNVEILMILAAIGSGIIGYWEEGAILIFIFAMSGALESYTTSKSHRELTALMDLQPQEAWLIEKDSEIRVPVEQLKVGDHILVKPGEQVPADGVIVNGKTSIDEATITGESIPVFKTLQDEVFAGTVNTSGAITVEVTKPNHETVFQKVINLIKQAQEEQTPSQQFIDRFESVYVYIVLFATGIMMFLPHYLFGWSWNETFYRAIVLLVVASPCAVVASITPAMLSAISNGARNGILFKGGTHLEALSHLKAIAFDKTGTLTIGRPEVTDFIVSKSLQDQEQALLQVAASIENQSNHPLAQAIVRYARERKITSFLDTDYVEDVTGWGIRGKINKDTWKIGKKDFMDFHNQAQWLAFIERFSKEGKTAVFIQKNDDVIGMFALKDQLRANAKNAISELQTLGVKPIMLTGDNDSTAQKIASDVGMKDYVSECLPDEKLEKIKEIKERLGTTAMVGDGINDAPALAIADIGIAMGEGTDVALETADVVLMKNNLMKIPQAIQLSKRLNRIIKQNLTFSIAVIILLIISNFTTGIDLPFAVIGHEGSTILVILNSLRLLRS